MPFPKGRWDERVQHVWHWLKARAGWEADHILDRVEETSGAARWQWAHRLRTVPLYTRHLRRILRLLDDPDAFLRWELAEILAQQKPNRVLPLCLERARAGDPVEGLTACLRVLAALRDPAGLDAILAHREHPNIHVRVAVADALAAFIERPDAQAALLQLLEDEAPAVRRTVTWTLRRSTAPWARPVLLACAQNSQDPWCTGA